MLLGIDFGTTRTVVAAARNGRYPVAAFDVGDAFKDYIPGIAAWRDGARVFGWEAARAVDAGDAVRSLKRVVSRLAPDQVVPGLGEPITALDLVTEFLVHIRQMITGASNLEVGPSEPLEVAVAVPANASTRQRYVTLEAFTRAGFSVVKMLNEPTAAAIEFAHRNATVLSARSPKRYVVVYDLGGGTFDTSAVSLEGRRFELLSSEGIGTLGGDDFDDIILELALVEAAIAHDDVPAASRSALLESCREAKESLRPTSRKLLVELPGLEPAGGETPSVVLATDAVYQRCQPVVDRTLDMVRQIFSKLGDHGIDADNPRELGGLYLVGGSVVFPPVARALRAQYKRKIQLAPEPHAATALGLAMSVDPDAGLTIKEATTRHFGVWREAAHGRDKVFDAILSKDTLPDEDQPIVISRTYRPSHPVGHLRFLECSSLTPGGQPAGDLTPWKEVLFPYDPALAGRGDLREVSIERHRVTDDEITETYTYDAAGRIAVAIANRSRGYQLSFVLGTLR